MKKIKLRYGSITINDEKNVPIYESNVKSIASKGKHGDIKNPRYIAVRIDEE